MRAWLPFPSPLATPVATPLATPLAILLPTLMALLIALLACGEADPGEPSERERTPPVRVWLTLGDSLVAVPRPEAGDSLRGALEALLAGPTAAERSRGLGSWFGDDTRGLLRGADWEGEVVVVDFRRSLTTAIPGAGSSAGSRVLLAALDSTVFQFPSVRAVEYRLEGSCAAFWEWLQRECAVVRRP